MTSIEDRQRVVIDLSVYNAISYLRRNPTAREIVNYLHASGWTPVWDDASVVVTSDSVVESAGRLQTRGLVSVEDDLLTLPSRGPNGLGQPVEINETRTDLSWRGKK